MKNKSKFLLLVVVLATGLSAHEVRSSNKPADAGEQMGERDKVREDQIAKLFESMRSGLKRPKLSRIGNRDDLVQRVCTIALSGTLPKPSSAFSFGFYKTADPESISTELNNVASFNARNPKSSLGFSGYSVAVWSVEDSQTAEATYWVGVHLYWSAVLGFFDDYFTDDIVYHNYWKKSVASPCRNK